MSIPRIERDLIGALGLGDRVRSLAIEGWNTHQIVEKLVEDPDVKERVGKLGGVRIYATDVYRYLVSDLAQKTELLGDGLSQDETAVVLQTAKERALAITQMGSEWDALAKRSLALLSTELDAYEEAKNLGDPEAKKTARFPHAQFDTTRKVVNQSLAFLRSIKSDGQVQALLRAHTVNVQQGISQDELHDILFAVGEQLGIPRARVVAAYTKALIARKRQKNPQRSDFVDAPAMPEFAEGLEQSSGMSPTEA